MNLPDSGKLLDKSDILSQKSTKNTIPLKSPRNAPSCHLKGTVVLWDLNLIPLEMTFSTTKIFTNELEVQ